MIDVSLNIWHVEACHRFLSHGTKALSSCRRLLLDSNVIEEEEEEEPEGHGAMVDMTAVSITRRVRTRSEAPLPSGTERGARGVFGQGPEPIFDR